MNEKVKGINATIKPIQTERYLIRMLDNLEASGAKFGTTAELLKKSNLLAVGDLNVNPFTEPVPITGDLHPIAIAQTVYKAVTSPTGKSQTWAWYPDDKPTDVQTLEQETVYAMLGALNANPVQAESDPNTTITKAKLDGIRMEIQKTQRPSGTIAITVYKERSAEYPLSHSLTKDLASAYAEQPFREMRRNALAANDTVLAEKLDRLSQEAAKRVDIDYLKALDSDKEIPNPSIPFFVPAQTSTEPVERLANTIAMALYTPQEKSSIRIYAADFGPQSTDDQGKGKTTEISLIYTLLGSTEPNRQDVQDHQDHIESPIDMNIIPPFVLVETNEHYGPKITTTTITLQKAPLNKNL